MDASTRRSTGCDFIAKSTFHLYSCKHTLTYIHVNTHYIGQVPSVAECVKTPPRGRGQGMSPRGQRELSAAHITFSLTRSLSCPIWELEGLWMELHVAQSSPGEGQQLSASNSPLCPWAKHDPEVELHGRKLPQQLRSQALMGVCCGAPSRALSRKCTWGYAPPSPHVMPLGAFPVVFSKCKK